MISSFTLSLFFFLLPYIYSSYSVTFFIFFFFFYTFHPLSKATRVETENRSVIAGTEGFSIVVSQARDVFPYLHFSFYSYFYLFFFPFIFICSARNSLVNNICRSRRRNSPSIRGALFFFSISM